MLEVEYSLLTDTPRTLLVLSPLTAAAAAASAATLRFDVRLAHGTAVTVYHLAPIPPVSLSVQDKGRSMASQN